MGVHTDYGIVTVLWSDGAPGLEVFLDGAWRPVAPVPGALLVNLGDLTAEWTNDRWRSTLHRVVAPPGHGPARRRSTAFFFDGNWDARHRVPAVVHRRRPSAEVPAGDRR